MQNFLSNVWGGIKSGASAVGTYLNNVSRGNTYLSGAPIPTNFMSGIGNYTNNPSGTNILGQTLPTAQTRVQQSPVTSTLNGQSYNASGDPIGVKQSSVSNVGVNTSQAQSGYAGMPQNNPYYTAPIKPVQYSVNSSDTVPGSALNPTNQSDANTAYTNAQNNFNAGTSTQTPTSKYIENLYNSYQYTPDQLAAIQKDKQAALDITTRQMQEAQQIRQMQSDGTITQAQSNPMIQDVQQRANADLANLNASRAYNAIPLSIAELQRQNNIQGMTALAPFYSPTQLSPGSSIVSPMGGTLQSGTGAAPSTVFQSAMTLADNARASGNMQYNSNGTENLQPYLDQAQQYYQTHGIIGSQSNTSANTSSNQTSRGTSAALPPNIQNQPYVVSTSDGTYINLDRVPSDQKNYIKQQAGNAGIPSLEAGDVTALQSLQYTKQQADLLAQSVESNLQSGTTGRIVNSIKSSINDVLQNSPALNAFNQARSTAIKSIQALVAGSGQGFRLTQPEIDTATANLPSASDSLENARVKLAWTNAFLGSKLNLLMTGQPNTAFTQNLSNFKGNTPTPQSNNSSSINWATLK